MKELTAFLIAAIGVTLVIALNVFFWWPLAVYSWNYWF